MVEPLHVIDGDDNPPRLHGRAERSQHGECDRRLIRRTVFGFGPPQRNLERPALRGGKRGQSLAEDRVENVGEAGVRELALDLGRAGRQDAHTARVELCERGSPDARLADAFLAFEHGGRGQVGEPGENLAQLLLTADQLRCNRRVHRSGEL